MCWTLLWKSSSYYNQNTATNLLTQMFVFIDTFCFCMTLCINVCLSADLHLMIKHPFQQKEGRVKWYMMYSVVFSLVLAVSCLTIVSSYSQIRWLAYSLNTALLLAFLVFIVSSIFSVTFARRKLSAPGISG